MNHAKLKQIAEQRAQAATAWTLIWAIIFVAQNTYFGWNYRPESVAESITDWLHIIPSIIVVMLWVKYWAVRALEEVGP